MGKVFVSQRGSPDRFPSIHNALTAKNVSCFLISLFVVKLFQRPVSVVSRGTVSFFCISPANINLQKYPGGRSAGHYRLARALIGRSCCCRGNGRGCEQVSHLQLSLLKLEGAPVPGMAQKRRDSHCFLLISLSLGNCLILFFNNICHFQKYMFVFKFLYIL